LCKHAPTEKVAQKIGEIIAQIIITKKGLARAVERVAKARCLCSVLGAKRRGGWSGMAWG